jgi:hypothetical protein
MSDLMPSAEAIECPAGLASAPVLESYPTHQAALPGAWSSAGRCRAPAGG